MGNSQSHTSKPFTSRGEEMYAKFENDWFAQGASRYAYRGRMKPTNWWSFKRGERCVVKLYKEEFCPILNEAAWKADNRASTKALEMAGLFNIRYKGRDIEGVEILIPIISQVKTFAAYKPLWRDPVPKTVRGTNVDGLEYANQMVPKDASAAIERFLQGQYVQFLSNSSYVNPFEDTLVPEAFSHFTYDESKGQILVTDLQGVHNQKSYTFTDPAIHSMETLGEKFGYYGPTDLGVYGVMKFFRDHKCNRLCNGLLKPDMSSIPAVLQGSLDQVIASIKKRKSSTYTVQLLKSGLTAEQLQELHTKIAKALAQSKCEGKTSQKIKRGLSWATNLDWKGMMRQAGTTPLVI